MHHKDLARTRTGPDSSATHGEGRDENELPLLIFKASVGDLKAVLALLKSGADCQATDDQGLTALHHASYFGHIKVVKALLAYPPETVRKALLFKTGAAESTCLHMACENGNFEVVKLLVQAGG